MKHETFTSFALEQNVYIECSNKTIIETVWNVFHAKKLPFMLWAKVVNVVVHVWNCTSNMWIGQTSYEMVYNSQLDVFYFKEISHEVFRYILKHLQKKLDVNSEKIIIIGYDLEGHAYRLWNSITKKVMVNTDVKIHKSTNIFLMLLNKVRISFWVHYCYCIKLWTN